MKVLVISSSPRIGGNSDVLCDEFIKGAKEAGHICEKLNINKLNLKPCTGCYSCDKTKKCIHKDGMDSILDSMIESDIIVLSTPVYFYSMAGQMKVFIDRTLPRYTEISNKKFYLILAAAENNINTMKSTVDALQGFLDCLDNSTLEKVIYGVGAWSKGDIYKLPILNETYEIGKSIK